MVVARNPWFALPDLSVWLNSVVFLNSPDRLEVLVGDQTVSLFSVALFASSWRFLHFLSSEVAYLDGRLLNDDLFLDCWPCSPFSTLRFSFFRSVCLVSPHLRSAPWVLRIL